MTRGDSKPVEKEDESKGTQEDAQEIVDLSQVVLDANSAFGLHLIAVSSKNGTPRVVNVKFQPNKIRALTLLPEPGEVLEIGKDDVTFWVGPPGDLAPLSSQYQDNMFNHYRPHIKHVVEKLTQKRNECED
ncbi:unnamed protein product [Amoebophrya sp. A25]|nr:unnamed protein product [Amoebophrya sp. A25]|eukprot:GSA25T00014900001.1